MWLTSTARSNGPFPRIRRCNCAFSESWMRICLQPCPNINIHSRVSVLSINLQWTVLPNKLAHQNRRDGNRNGDSRQKSRTASLRLPIPITSTNSEFPQKSSQFTSLSTSAGPLFAAVAVIRSEDNLQMQLLRLKLYFLWRRKTSTLFEGR